MNMMLYRYGSECIIVDAGIMFPGEEHLGVDVVIPDLGFLDQCGELLGVILTHGHEDHIGALPHLLARHDVPVYAAAHARGLVRGRLAQHEKGESYRLEKLPKAGRRLQIGPFEI